MADTAITELSLEDRQLEELPAKVIERCGNTLIKLDLTSNAIKSGANFSGLAKLEQLVLDKNALAGLVDFPSLPKVHTLWLNNNNIENLDKAMEQIRQAFPALTYLSMLFNPCVPNIFVDDSAAEAYQRYRYHVISKVPKLLFLDSTPVTEVERQQAKLSANVAIARPKGRAAEAMVVPSVTHAPPKPPSSPPRVATYLAKGKPRYDGANSEGNRFIVNDDL